MMVAVDGYGGSDVSMVEQWWSENQVTYLNQRVVFYIREFGFGFQQIDLLSRKGNLSSCERFPGFPVLERISAQQLGLLLLPPTMPDLSGWYCNGSYYIIKVSHYRDRMRWRDRFPSASKLQYIDPHCSSSICELWQNAHENSPHSLKIL